MQTIDKQKLEDCLNAVAMEDTNAGYRPVHSAAQLYYQRNNVSPEEIKEIEAALDALYLEGELDRQTEVTFKLFRSQKFGSKREMYMEALATRQANSREIKEHAITLETLVSNDDETFFEKDYAWYCETISPV